MTPLLWTRDARLLLDLARRKLRLNDGQHADCERLADGIRKLERAEFPGLPDHDLGAMAEATGIYSRGGPVAYLAEYVTTSRDGQPDAHHAWLTARLQAAWDAWPTAWMMPDTVYHRPLP